LLAPFLVRLALADDNNYPVGSAFDRFAVNCGELRPSECAGEADQEQRTVADILGGLSKTWVGGTSPAMTEKMDPQ
jgi:hypothetical protein